MSSCSNWQSNELGPLNIDYLYFYECQSKDFRILAAWLLVIWVIYLINILGTTASNYFSPTISSICDKLQLRYDIAGVTFLAFGNGAPDVFSSISSFSGSSVDGSLITIGVGALLGGSFFVSSIVVGSIALICPCEVNPKFFVRDIMFHIIAVSTLTLVGSLQYISLTIGLSLFLVYILYVTIVLTTSSGNIDQSLTASSNTSNIIISGIQTAFWHKSVSSKKKNQRKFRPLPQYDEFSDNSFDLNNSDADSSGGYKFLILNDLNLVKSSTSTDNDSKSTILDGEITINLTGGIDPVEFEGVIVEDYFNNECKESSNNNTYDIPSVTTNNEVISFESGSDITDSLRSSTNKYISFDLSHSSESLTTTLLQEDEIIDNSDQLSRHSSNTNVSQNKPMNSFQEIRKGSKQYNNSLTALYWQQKAFSHKIRKQLFDTEFWSSSIFRKVSVVLELPASFARDLTIPTCESNVWNKYYAIIQPITCSMFLAYSFGLSNGFILGIPTILFWIIFATPISIMIYLLTHFNKPPKNLIINNLWNICGFTMSIVWIYTLAKELIICLSSMGEAFHISPAFLGLTVLAWGNSCGDFFSNTAIARQGIGEMALAGCYGGPVFNILIGLGLSFTYACWKTYPNTFPLHLNISSIVSLVFLYISLISTLILVVLWKFRIERFMGYYLIGLYVVYTLCQFAILPFDK